MGGCSEKEGLPFRCRLPPIKKSGELSCRVSGEILRKDRAVS